MNGNQNFVENIPDLHLLFKQSSNTYYLHKSIDSGTSAKYVPLILMAKPFLPCIRHH